MGLTELETPEERPPLLDQHRQPSTMDLRVLLAACLVGVVCSQRPPEDKCGGRECPRYSVEETGVGFEVRQYEPAKWVAVTIPNTGSWRQKHQFVRKLDEYFEGANNIGATLERTMPMLKKLEGEMTSPDFRKTVMFMLPADQQAAPPTPTDADVTIVEMPAMTVYSGVMERPERNGGRPGRHGHRGQPGGHRGGRRGGHRGGRRGGRRGHGQHDGEDDAVARFRRGLRRGMRGGRSNGNGDRAAMWQQFMNEQVDAMRQKLGDRTVQEDVMFMAIYGRPHSPRSVKEMWLLPAKTEG